MYRVIIADDEEPVLDSFAFIFGKDVTDFELCGKARSGTEAVTLIKELVPDLVFMDIQMPGIDGIEAIKQVRSQFPAMIFVLATAYERFDIAKKAIPLGVFSYMVKPVSRKALIEKLQEIKIHLDSKNEERKNQLATVEFLQQTRDEKKKHFLTSLIYKNPTEKEWKDFTALFSFTSSKAAVYLIETIGSVSEKLKDDIYHDITKKLQYKIGCISSTVGERLLILITEEKDPAYINGVFQRIFDETSKAGFILGAGEFCSPKNLSSSFAEAFLPFADASHKESSCLNEQKRLQELCRTIIKSDKSTGKKAFEEYWLERFNLDDFLVAKGKMIGLFTLLLSEIGSNILSGSSFKTDIAAEIMALENVLKWRDWSSRTISNLQDILEIHRNSSYPDPLVKALAFIRENYNQQIQLSSVAELCTISASYLSRLFSEHLDSNFIDYVNRFRLNEAMILLKEGHVSIKETAYMVGYQDPNYFSRIFRKYMGFAPSHLEKRSSADD